MEAKKFGFGLMPPAFKFDPTDADIVAHYLLPRALNLPSPYAGAIIEDDPGSAPPWEMLRRHGYGEDLDHAFFFGPPTDPSKNAGRRGRAIQGGGVWQGQQSAEETVALLRPGGGVVDIRYKRYDLSFCLDKRRGSSTGYVMHEFEIVSPPLPGAVLTRIRVPKKVTKNKKQVALAPGPSYEYNAAVACNDEGFGGAQDDAPYGAGHYSTPLQYALPSAEYRVSIPDQSGASYSYDTAAMNGEGFTGAQANAFYGGGDYINYSDPSNYVSECGGDYSNYSDPSNYVSEHGGDYSNYYGEYQQDPSNQCKAEDADEVCFSEQQAGALCGNSENGSVVGTESSALSTVSHCGDGGIEWGDIIS